MPYFDHNATAPLLSASRDAWLQASAENWQNPASPYRSAARAKIALDAARARLGSVLGCHAGRLVFTSGATEAANAILRHWARTLPGDRPIAVNPAEHPCVLEAVAACFPGRVRWLPLLPGGAVDPAALRRLLAETGPGESLAGVVAMAANNETGACAPWREIAAACRGAGISYLCDATQWLGKLPADGLGDAPWFFASAHKFGGPKGAGFLAVPTPETDFRAQLGGAQQRGLRAGTEDLPNAAALVEALAACEPFTAEQRSERLAWRRRFEETVVERVPGTRVVGAGADRLWNTTALLMPHTENHRWVLRLDRLGFQVSTGSACATGREGPSHVLTALGYSPVEARRAVRVSAGWETTSADWNSLAEALSALEKEFRADNSNLNLL